MKTIYRFSDRGYPKNKLNLVNNESCFINFCNNFLSQDLSDLILIEDNCSKTTIDTFNGLISEMKSPPCIIQTTLGNAGSFNFAVSYAMQNFSDDEIVYFVEGDYIHDINSKKVFESGFNLSGKAVVDYVTLYAHPDKEFVENISPEYIFRSNESYWRTCISTTMTFGSKVRTLKEDVQTIFKWTSGTHPDDHKMFSDLRGKGRLLISPIPGYSTHGETNWLSPFKDWDNILLKSIS